MNVSFVAFPVQVAPTTVVFINPGGEGATPSWLTKLIVKATVASPIGATAVILLSMPRALSSISHDRG